MTNTLLIMLIIASMALAACAGTPSTPAPTSEPIATETVEPSQTSVPTLECGGVIWNVTGTCVNDIATFIAQGETIHASAIIDTVKLTVHIEIVNVKNHVNDYPTCYFQNGYIDNPIVFELPGAASTTNTLYYDIHCTVNGVASAFAGTIVWPVQSPLGLTLTAFAPTAGGFSTLTPTSTETLTATP